VRRRQDPSLESFFARGKQEPFFVKNLENIQGDERDAILLSVTYAKDSSGVLRYNFGPLNGENGWRRLNVLTTRARKSMRVFSSMKGDEVNPVHATSQGPQLLRDFLLYAEHGRLNSTVASRAAETESPFEREVFTELTTRGIKLQPQVGVAGYRIDFGVLDNEVAGRYLCSIECDGAAYHSSEAARDRDRLRQQVLEARGWTIHRLWSTDWFKDRHGQIKRLLELIERTRRRVIEEQVAEEEARQRLAALEQEAAQVAQDEEISGESTSAGSPSEAAPVRLQASPYVFAETPILYAGQDLSFAPASLISQAIDQVVAVEAPLHIIDLAARVAARWDCLVSAKRMNRIRTVAEMSAEHGRIHLHGDFVYDAISSGSVLVRQRAGTKITPERIAPKSTGKRS
jgi:very-short-patch-repair endonuclease